MRFGFVLALLTVTLAQMPEQHSHAISASDIGEVRFSTTCSADAAKSVETGVALLHSFWYSEAERTFRRAIQSDRQCAMAYWGVAMSQYYPLWPTPLTPERLHIGSEAIAAARNVTAGSPREHAYVDALSAFYEQPAGTSVHDRAVKYESAMAALTAQYPDDDEAAIFYALALNGAALPTDKTYARQKQAAAILNRLLPAHPHHPGIIHYLIHSNDTPELAPLALDAARTYAKIAPSVPHAQHMPSHIFTRLGLWDESVASNLQAAKAAREHHEVDEQLHAMDYLEYAYLQLGRFADAKRVIAEMRALPLQQQPDTKITYAIAAIPARYALERHDWRAAAALMPATGGNPRTAALTQFAIGIGSARSGDVAAAKRAENALTGYVDSLTRDGDNLWRSQVFVQQMGVAAWRLFAQGHRDEAEALMRSAADEEDRSIKPAVTPGALLPARELLADMLLEMKRANDALTEYKAVLAVAPNRRNAVAGQAKAQLRIKSHS
jgi:tetratricopeptide (TPR) repeat protein